MGDRWPDGRPAAVSITFDGGYATSVEHALPLLAARRMPSTWFLVAGAIGGSLEGRAVAGWDAWSAADPALVEVGNHSFSHPLVRRGAAEVVERAGHAARRLATPGGLHAAVERVTRGPVDPGAAPRRARPAAAIADFAAGQRLLETRLGAPVTSFAYPNGRHRPRFARALARMGHTSARTSTPGCNDPEAVHPFALASRTWIASQADGTAAGWIDEALATGGWCIEVLHVVGRDEDYPWTVRPDQLAAHLDALEDAGVWVATQRDVLSHLRERESVGC